MERLGTEAAEQIASWLRDLGIELVGDTSVAAIHDGREVVLEDGRRIGGALRSCSAQACARAVSSQPKPASRRTTEP